METNEKHQNQILLDEGNQIAQQYAMDMIGQNVMIYPCGYAWVSFDKTKNSPFGKWLIDYKIDGAYICPSTLKVQLWIRGPYNQSMDHKFAHAEKLAEFLRSNGIQCTANCKLD